MKKLLLVLSALIILIGGIAYAFESNIVTFYRSATGTAWTDASDGYALAVLPFTIWTCQAETAATATALTLRVVGNITGSNFSTSAPIATNVCSVADLASGNFCRFGFTTTPVLQMRIDVTTLTGTSTTSTNKVMCLGGFQ